MGRVGGASGPRMDMSDLGRRGDLGGLLSGVWRGEAAGEDPGLVSWEDSQGAVSVLPSCAHFVW